MKYLHYILTTLLCLLLLVGVEVFNLNTVYASTTVQVSAWGGGGGGFNLLDNGRAGGGGGAYAGLNAFPITSGVGYTVTVGGGGAVATNGATTTFNGAWPTASLSAAPGWADATGLNNGLGGATASSTGDVLHSGGNGGGASSGLGGSGGGAGGTTANGGGGTTSGAFCANGGGGVGGATGGGNGAATNIPHIAGDVPGGGGGGSDNSANCDSETATGGGAGKVIIKATLGLITSATGGTHTSDASFDYWTFTASGTWTPTFSPATTLGPSILTVSHSMIVRGSFIVK